MQARVKVRAVCKCVCLSVPTDRLRRLLICQARVVDKAVEILPELLLYADLESYIQIVRNMTQPTGSHTAWDHSKPIILMFTVVFTG